jgi:hypothetical protein
MLAVNEVGRAAARGSSKMASGNEYCGTKLLTFKNLREVCLKSLR